MKYSSQWPHRQLIESDGLLKPVGVVDAALRPFPNDVYRRNLAQEAVVVCGFANLDLDDKVAIRHFAERYGLLGLLKEQYIASPDKGKGFAKTFGLTSFHNRMLPEVDTIEPVHAFKDAQRV